ncbi:hypothetical protein JCM15764A_06960 [Geotalea toluenoxydans]
MGDLKILLAIYFFCNIINFRTYEPHSGIDAGKATQCTKRAGSAVEKTVHIKHKFVSIE